jgi:hypothetical protein
MKLYFSRQSDWLRVVELKRVGDITVKNKRALHGRPTLQALINGIHQGMLCACVVECHTEKLSAHASRLSVTSTI